MHHLAKFTFFITIGLLFLIHLFNFSVSQAKERATSEYQQFSTGNIKDEDVFTKIKKFKIDGGELEGFVLGNSETMIALYIKATKTKEETVMVIPLNTIQMISASRVKQLEEKSSQAVLVPKSE